MCYDASRGIEQNMHSVTTLIEKFQFFGRGADFVAPYSHGWQYVNA